MDTTKKIRKIKVDNTLMGISPLVDANITPENIKQGVEILGVQGAFAGGELQEKEISITKNGSKVILPDSQFFGLSKVTISVDVQPTTTSPIYGVEWVNDGTTTMTRTDDATSMTYAISNGRVASDFDNVFPYNQMKRQTIGENVFVYVPPMFWRIGFGEDKKITSVAVSETQGADKEGCAWYESKGFYYGAYGASSDGAILKSIAGQPRVARITRAEARQRAMAVGAGYHQRDLYAGTILMFLWWIEFANKNSSDTGGSVPGVFPMMNGTECNTGGTDTFYNETEGETFCVSGYDTSTNQMVWHGIEDYIGNYYEWEDGITGDDSRGGVQYVSDDYTLYDDYSNGSQMSPLSYNSPTTSGNTLEALGWDETKPFLCQPIATRDDGYTFETGFCDYTDTINLVVSYRGAGWNSGANYGVSCFYRYYASSAYHSIGARLISENL